MTIDYLKKMAKSMLQKFGTEEILVTNSNTIFNIEDGKNVSTKTENKILFVKLEATDEKFDASLGFNVASNEFICLVNSPVVPLTSDTLIVASLEYTIAQIKSISFKNEDIFYFIKVSL